MSARRWCRALVASAVSVVAAAAPASAQVVGAQWCASDVYNDAPPVRGADAVERMHPLLSRARYADAVRDGAWLTALKGARDDATQAFVAAGVPQPAQASFLAQLDTVIGALPRLPASTDPAHATFVADTLRTIRFRPRPTLSAYQLFRGAPRIDVTGLAPRQVAALCYSAMSVDAILFRLAVPLEGAALARLARLTTSWSNYRTYGYTKQPLELLLSPGRARDTLPNRGQWLVGHLSLGLELGGRVDSIATSATTVVELGRIWYRNDWTQYAGLSAIVGVPTRGTVGYGAMAHLARGLRAGALAHRADGRTRMSAVVSSDLYGLLERSKQFVDERIALVKGIVVLPEPTP